MNLVFKQGSIPESLFQELDFKTYLEQFSRPLPTLGQMLLKPLKPSEIEAFFQKLREMKSYQDQGLIDSAELVLLCTSLPNLEEELQALESQAIEVPHLFQLGCFLENEFPIQNQEKKVPVNARLSSKLVDVHKILRQTMESGFGNLKMNSITRNYLEQMEGQKACVESEIMAYEKQIFQETGLRITYPYPRDLSRDHSELEKIKKSSLLKSSPLESRVRIEYCPPETLRISEMKMADLEEKIEGEYAKKLSQINAKLQPYLKPLKQYYKERCERIYTYVLLDSMTKVGLEIPEFRKENGILAKKAILPALKAKLGKKYKPLNLHLKSGSNVLFGSNMTGKTTVLKTLYFLATLVHHGLPIPVEHMSLSPPCGVFLCLRSSGNLQESLSSLGDELMFWSGDFPKGSYIFVDELFQSVEPVSGAALARVVLNDLKGSSKTLLATTHYAELLKLKGLNHLRMKPFQSQVDSGKSDSSNFLSQVPFEVESVGQSARDLGVAQANEVLRAALSFPLPKSIKKEIKSLMTKSGSKQ